MPYSLRCSISAHSNDVRCLALMNNFIVSGSRDKTLKIWTENGKSFEETKIVSCHTNFISSVCVLPPSDLYPNGLIFSGSHDQKIIGYTPPSVKPFVTLIGHNGTVCCLTPSRKKGYLISSSWDATAKVWDISTGQCTATLFGHSQTVWCVITMPEGFIVTGSADQLINVFSSDGSLELIRTLQGHTDCVRGLTYAGQGMILSCSNDGTIRKWKVATGEPLDVFQCHDSFIYSVVAKGPLVAFGGEDNILSVWSGGRKGFNERQVSKLPSTSVWAVEILPNTDIVAGCSDGYIRIFTQDSSRMASTEELAMYEKEFSNKKETNGTTNTNTLNLPGKEALSVDGQFEGEMKLIHDDGINYCYSWSLQNNSWNLLGEECSPPENAVQTQELTVETPKYYPPEKHIFFENFDLKLISKKLNEFIPHMNLPEQDVKNITSGLTTLATTTDADKVCANLQILIDSIAKCPDAYVYPVLDITRISALSSTAHPIIFSDENAPKLLKSLSRFLTPESLVNNKMFLFRIFSNMFSGDKGKKVIYSQREILFQSVPDLINVKHRGLEVAVSTFILNAAYSALNRKDSDDANLVLLLIKRIIPLINDPEATFRLLVALGTIGSIEGTAIFTEDILKALQTVSLWKAEDPAAGKAAMCAKSILNKLSH